MRKVKISLLLLLVIFTYSCNNKEQETKYYWVTAQESINQIARINQQEKEDTTVISYFAQQDTLNYYLLKKNRDQSFLISTYQNGLLRPLQDTTVILENGRYRIAKYIQNEALVNGGVIHYYTPAVGVFAMHAKTIPGLQYLQSTDTVQSRQVKALIKATVPEFYIRGTLKAELENY